MKTVSEQMELARKAQAIVNDYTQEQIDEICLAIGWEVYEDENIAKLAKMAVEETGYGNVQSKIIKHKRKVGGVLHDRLDDRTGHVFMIGPAAFVFDGEYEA